jgi:hypothetical protein
MSNPKSRTILDRSKSDLDSWCGAIADAEKKIQEAKVKISALRKSIKTFKRLHSCGAPFPCDDKNQNEARI